jgi:hypothetical protein
MKERRRQGRNKDGRDQKLHARPGQYTQINITDIINLVRWVLALCILFPIGHFYKKKNKEKNRNPCIAEHSPF